MDSREEEEVVRTWLWAALQRAPAAKALTLSVTLGQVVDVVLMEVLVEGGSKQLLGQVSQDSCGSGGENTKALG